MKSEMFATFLVGLLIVTTTLRFVLICKPRCVLDVISFFNALSVERKDVSKTAGSKYLRPPVDLE